MTKLIAGCWTTTHYDKEFELKPGQYLVIEMSYREGRMATMCDLESAIQRYIDKIPECDVKVVDWLGFSQTPTLDTNLEINGFRNKFEKLGDGSIAEDYTRC